MKRWGVVVVALIVVVAGGVGITRYRERQHQRLVEEREAALRSELASMRRAIASFRGDNGRFPVRLEELVPKYLPRVPADPMTNEVSWRLITEERVEESHDFTTDAAPKSESVIVDVRSLAPGYSEF